MTAKEALEMLNKCGTNIEQPFEDYVLEALNKALTELEAIKRYPTSDEVCKALSEYFGDDYKVNVSTSNQIFVEHKDDRDGDVCIEYDGELIYFDNFSLPPHLITLIGRFYEGLEK